jgi:hypothetical protein
MSKLQPIFTQAEKGGMMERFLDIHMYITAALEKTDMRAVGLQLAMDLLYEKVIIRLTFTENTKIVSRT